MIEHPLRPLTTDILCICIHYQHRHVDRETKGPPTHSTTTTTELIRRSESLCLTMFELTPHLNDGAGTLLANNLPKA